MRGIFCIKSGLCFIDTLVWPLYHPLDRFPTSRAHVLLLSSADCKRLDCCLNEVLAMYSTGPKMFTIPVNFSRFFVRGHLLVWMLTYSLCCPLLLRCQLLQGTIDGNIRDSS